MAVVPGVEVAVDLGPPNKLNPDGAAAGVDEGAAEEVAPPREGKGDCCVVLVDVVGGADGWLVPVESSDGKAGFAAESGPDVGVLKSDDVCAPCACPAAGAGAPNSGFEMPPPDVAGVVDSACLSLPTLENGPALGAGVVPNVGVDICCGVDPKRLPEGCCEALPNNGGVPEAGAVVDGVVDEGAALTPPKRAAPGFWPVCPRSDCPCPAALPCGGGPAGVVD